MITKNTLFQHLFYTTVLTTACSMMAMELPPMRSKSPVNLLEIIDLISQESIHILLAQRQAAAQANHTPFESLVIIEVRYPASEIGEQPTCQYFEAGTLDAYFRNRIESGFAAHNAAVQLKDPSNRDEIITVYEDGRQPSINRDFFNRVTAYSIGSISDSLHRLNLKNALPYLFTHINRPPRQAPPRSHDHPATIFETLQELPIRMPVLERHAAFRGEAPQRVRPGHFLPLDRDISAFSMAFFDRDGVIDELMINPGIIRNRTFATDDLSIVHALFRTNRTYLLAKKLSLSNMDITKLPDNIPWSMPELEQITLCNTRQIQSFESSVSIPPRLKVLRINTADGAPNSFSTFDGLTLPNGSPKFPNLEELVIADAPMLHSFHGFPALQHLKTLRITRGSHFENIEGLPILPALQELTYNEQTLRGEQIPAQIRGR